MGQEGLAIWVFLESLYPKESRHHFELTLISRTCIEFQFKVVVIWMAHRVFTVSKEKWHALTPKRAGFWWKLQMLKAFHTWFTKNQRVKRHMHLRLVWSRSKGVLLQLNLCVVASSWIGDKQKVGQQGAAAAIATEMVFRNTIIKFSTSRHNLAFDAIWNAVHD